MTSPCSAWLGVPVAKKCCFCVPVRRGVIIFGYVNLVVSLLMFPLLVFMVAEQATRGAGAAPAVGSGARLQLACVLVVLDAAMTVVMLVGAHKKLRALLVLYAWFALVFQLVSLAVDLLLFFDSSNHAENALYFLLLGLNLYLVYLVQSVARRLPARPPPAAPPLSPAAAHTAVLQARSP